MGDLLKIRFQNGTDYSSAGVRDFLRPLLFQGDSGFTKLGLYHQCETNGVSYAIRLKGNGSLRKPASHIDEQFTETTKDDRGSCLVCYGEFQYQASSWEYPHRVVCNVKKSMEQRIHMYTFIVSDVNIFINEMSCLKKWNITMKK